MTPDEDHHLASDLARQTGELLLELRNRVLDQDDSERRAYDGYDYWGGGVTGSLRWEGDQAAHEFLMKELSRLRPDDAVLSEEGRDDRSRLNADRVWIVDPLDGSNDYPNPNSSEWAVHVALVVDGEPVAGAVSVPGQNQVYSTLMSPTTRPTARDKPLILSGRSAVRAARIVAAEIGADVATCGSAGVKAMAVVSGVADLYVHGGWMYEWDSCAPEVVARAAGLDVSNLAGERIEYNKSYPEIAGFMVSRPEFTEAAIEALGS